MKITDTEITKNFYDFSCQANTYSVLQIESKQVKKEPKFIIPDTDTEKVFDAVCKK